MTGDVLRSASVDEVRGRGSAPRRPLLARPGVAKALAPWVVGVALLALWQGACMLYRVPAYLVPSPSAIVAQFAQDAPLLFGSLLVTLKITLLAFVCATVLGVAIALLFVQSPLIEASLFPYAVLLQVTPVVAIAPLIIIWVKDTTAALVVCATLVALFPVISNTALGLRSVNPGLVNLFRIHRATRWQTLVRLRIPCALPYFFGGLRISSGLALIGAVVAEFVAGTGGSGAGLAYQILQAGFQLNIPRLFAALALITVTGVLLFAATVWLSRVALRGWHDSEL
ncbi:NitT/TauT family transport system permease protein [Paraburkholderia caballeronis]|uniref:ABC transporter permease n=1 Tax=Paraburkholderia caballeronis TaxID=416943 RepID=UPI0010663965|nr:ABC transporter permease [Paraburkholderia caballeronis]TDV35809.1 NitT/TauT family transport system permease protein [Paraburkholderia caballeronis]